MPNPYYTKPYIDIGKYTRSTPIWAGTPQHQPKVLVPGGGHLNGDGFTTSTNAIPVVVGSAGAAIGATSIPLTPALATNLAIGKILSFGTGKFARLTAAAVVGATTLTVEPLVAALVSGNTAYSTSGTWRVIESGLLVGRTYAERDAGIGYGPWAAGDDEGHLLFFDVHDVKTDNECELYLSFGANVVYENLLPNWVNLATDAKAFIRRAYTCLVGVV